MFVFVVISCLNPSVCVCVYVAVVGSGFFLPLLPVVYPIKGKQSTGNGQIGLSCGN